MPNAVYLKKYLKLRTFSFQKNKKLSEPTLLA